MPYINHFIQPDTIIPDQTNPQVWDRYAYVGNNPLRFNDPTGHVRVDGCSELVGGCSVKSIQQTKDDDLRKANEFRQTTERNQCQAGNKLHCSYAENHPLETVAFVGGGLLLTGGVGGLLGSTTLTTETASTLTSTTTYLCANDGDCSNEIQTGTNTVYQVVQNGKTIYVGITKNFDQRAAYWFNKNNWDIKPIPGLFQSLNRADARAVEQVLIEHYGLGNLANQINSIAATNPTYQSAIQRGNEILQTIGFFGE